MNKIIIGIDNGNKCIKSSESYVSETGFVKSDVEPISKQNLLIYKGNYYSIGSNRLSVQMDKSISDDAYILSLPAIADAIVKEGINCEEQVDVYLGVGLPIVNYGNYKVRFREYFLNRNEVFQYGGKTFRIKIVDCKVYPQAYSGVICNYQNYKGVSVANVIDIGGFTVDFFKMEHGMLNPASAYSSPTGIITLLTSIQQELLKQNMNLTEGQIQDLIMGEDPIFFGDSVKEIIQRKTKEYVENLLSKLIENGLELRNTNIFLGGGSTMLKKYIDASDKIKYADYMDNFANANGYKILLENELNLKRGQ